MKLRAVIFDVYGTLLEVGPAPADADARWQDLWRQTFSHQPRLSRLEFSVACSRIIARHHTRAQACGIAHPEVYWPSIVGEVIPEMRALRPDAQEEFLFRQIQTGHTTRFEKDAAEMLRQLARDGTLLGIASNAQAYTKRELREGLSAEGLNPHLFDPDLCFWSFEHGFSKPDPHVFQILTARLEAHGVAPAETLMVGDRLDNDIQPAHNHGWRTWQLSSPGQPGNGNWHRLLTALLNKTLPLQHP